MNATFLLAGCLALACAPAGSEGSPLPVNPFASAEPVDPAASRFSGRVIERLVAGSYVYLLVESEGRAPAWVVTAQAIAPDANRVHVRVVRRVDRFESRKLSRTFAPLWFGVVEKDSS